MDNPQAAQPEGSAAPAMSWQQPAAGSTPGMAGFVYADVPNRIFALILDAIVLVVIAVIVGIVLGVVGLSTGALNAKGEFNPIATLISGLVLVLLYAAYFVWSWTTSRATLGMRVLGMQVGNAFDGKTLTMDQALRRAAALWGPSTVAQILASVAIIGPLLGLAAFGWSLYLLYSTAKSPTKQGAHDIFANSVVVKAGRVV